MFMNHPERASLLEMWHEQMQVRTLREQNQQILVLVKRIRSAEARLGLGRPWGSCAYPLQGESTG
jgi:hypothetical protein